MPLQIHKLLCAGHNFNLIVLRKEIILKWLYCDPTGTLHVDATGSICRKPDSAGSKTCIFYYAIVGNFGHRHLPIAEMLSVTHNVATIASWLLHFVALVRQLRPSFKSRTMVTDQSAALMKPISTHFPINQ